MYAKYSEFLGTGTTYMGGKVLLKGLTEAEISKYEGTVNRIDRLGFNPDDETEQNGLSTGELSSIMSRLATQEPNEVLGVLSIPQGRWLYANHNDFKPKEGIKES